MKPEQELRTAMTLEQLIARIKQRAYLDSDEQIGEWIKEYAASQFKQIAVEPEKTAEQKFVEGMRYVLSEIVKAHDEYQAEHVKGCENSGYFRGKADAYGYAARKIRESFNWHGLPLIAGPKLESRIAVSSEPKTEKDEHIEALAESYAKLQVLYGEKCAELNRLKGTVSSEGQTNHPIDSSPSLDK